MQNGGKIDILKSIYFKFREHGLKLTPQRIAVYENLIKSGKHLAAEELYRLVKRDISGISLDTVNRTLRTFAKIGLVEIVEDLGSSRRYDSNLNKHHHFHCVKCGAIIDFYDEEYDNLKIPPRIRHRYEIRGKRVVISGVCDKCRDRKKYKSNRNSRRRKA